MAFKLKYKDKDGVEVELDFEQIEFDDNGFFILTGEDKVTGEIHKFVWEVAQREPPVPVR